MTALRFLKASLTGLVAALTVAGGLTLAPAPSQAACYGCGFDVGVGLGGLALGALAAGSRANQQPYAEPEGAQGPRQRGRRPPIVNYDPSDPEAPHAEAPAPAQAPQQRPAKRKEVAQKPAEGTARKVAAAPAPESEAKKSSRSVALANSGALEP